MKRAACVLLALCLMGTCLAEPVELVVFAAASLTEALTRITEDYRAVAPDVALVFNFDSSGTLRTQVEEGAECDVFLSAAPRQMDELEQLGFVIPESRLDLLENKVALAVPEGNPAGIASFDDLAERLRAGNILLAVGNADVPVGQYTQKIFAHYGLAEDALAGCLTYGSNVKEVAAQVRESTVDCGIIYATDAASAHLTVVDTATGEMCGRVIYPAAVLNISSNVEAARAFLNYLTGEEAGAVFASVGFAPLG